MADELGGDVDRTNPGAIPTIPGGVELAPVDVAAVLTGEGLAYGAPLPSEQVAGDAFLVDDEIQSVLVRRVHDVAAGRQVAEVTVLTLDGAEIFDDVVLAAFERGLVAAVGGGEVTDTTIADRTVLQARDEDGRSTIGYRDGSLLIVVTAPDEADALDVVTRQLQARAAGAMGTAEPSTPLVATAPDAVFVEVPGVAFAPFLPPEQEPIPLAPELPGVTAAAGRHAVLAGERRSLVWAFSVDPAVYPTAEALTPALPALAAARAGGVAPDAAELGGHVVLTSVGPASTAQVFRHQGLVLVVEGADAAQVDAVASAWIAALGPT